MNQNWRKNTSEICVQLKKVHKSKKRGNVRLFVNYQSDAMSKKPKRCSLYKQNIFWPPELGKGIAILTN